MDKDFTVARPYAKSVFEVAKQEGTLQNWQDFLSTLTEIINDSSVDQLIKDLNLPIVTKLLLEISAEKGYSDAKFLNFINLISENNRIEVIPSIFEMYQTIRQEYDLPTPVTVVSAYDLTQDQLDKISNSLGAKFSRKIILSTEIDKSIIGGIIVKSDLGTYNSSVKQQLLSLQKMISK